MASSRRKNRASHSKRSTIPSPPSDDALVQIDQEWDRMLTAPEASKRILV